MAQIHKLTDVKVKALKAGFHSDGAGLYLKVTPAGTKSWVFRYEPLDKREDGKRPTPKDLGLGPYPSIGLAAARDIAEEMRKKRKLGIDPGDERRQRREAARTESAETAKAKAYLTFEKAARDYLTKRKAKWKNPKSLAQWESSLITYVSPKIGSLDAAAIKTSHVLEILEPLWAAGEIETGTRVRGRVELILQSAAIKEDRSDGYFDPARWRGLLDGTLEKKGDIAPVKPQNSMSYRELPEFMQRLREHTGFASKALQFCILAATRTSETLGAKWSEFDLEENVWTVPSERLKQKKGQSRVHRVPLSKEALAVLAEMREVRRNDLTAGRPRR
jgi:integrase